MHVAFHASVPKDAQRALENADVFRCGPRSFALSDGAEETFGAREWAHVLAAQYADRPWSDPGWLDHAISQFEVCLVPEYLPLSQIPLYEEKGSQASLLGGEFDSNSQRLSLLAIGDSLAALVDGDSLRQVFPHRAASDFRCRPQRISTKTSLNTFLSAENFLGNHRVVWDLTGLRKPEVLCMTAPLGEWFLKTREASSDGWRRLRECRSPEELAAFVASERANECLRIDDTTLAIVQFRV